MKRLESVFRFRFGLEKRRVVLHLLFSFAVLLLCTVFYSPRSGILFFILYLLPCGLICEPRRESIVGILNFLYCTLFFLLSFYCVKVGSCQNVFPPFLGIGKELLNMLCLAVPCGVCYLITGKAKSALTAGTFFAMVLVTANQIVFSCREKELLFSDLFSAKTAFSVIEQYDLYIAPLTAYCWMLWFFVALCRTVLPLSFPKDVSNRKCRRIWAAACTGLCCVLIAGCSTGIPIKTWSSEGSTVNGYLLNYTISIRDAFVRKPADYSVAAVDRLGETYASDTAFTGDLPNIIVIMNESFADLSVFGDELRTNIPVTPFMDSFKEEAVSGWALSSVYGGNTANAEFEFLTGATMGFLPEGSVPYQQYIKGNVFSLAWVLDGLGYDCRATHPFHAGGWSRTRIYPQLGFSAWHFVDEYPQKDLVREYVSDREMYAYILEMLEKDTADAPLFLFGITMQNHGGYGYEGENYEQTVFLQGYSGDYPEAEQYLTLIHESDAAMASFVAELSALEEKTVLLFFGDHHPKLGATLHTELHGDEIDTLEEQMLQYTVPFYIWANFDIPEYTIECTSLNYLAMHVLQVAGIDLPAPYRFLEEMRETIPAMNALGYYSAEQDKFISYDDAAGEESVWLQNYAILQYNNLFDAENRSEKLFGRYIGQKK